LIRVYVKGRGFRFAHLAAARRNIQRHKRHVLGLDQLLGKTGYESGLRLVIQEIANAAGETPALRRIPGIGHVRPAFVRQEPLSPYNKPAGQLRGWIQAGRTRRHRRCKRDTLGDLTNKPRTFVRLMNAYADKGTTLPRTLCPRGCVQAAISGMARGSNPGQRKKRPGVSRPTNSIQGPSLPVRQDPGRGT